MSMAHVIPFRAAVIGGGNIGAAVGTYMPAVQPGSHAQAYLRHPDVVLAAFVEPNAARHDFLRAEYAGVPIFTDVNTMLTEVQPKIVSVATPTDVHKEPVLFSAQHNVPVILCEKPLGYSLDDAQEMIRVCADSGSQLFVNHQRRFDPLLQTWAKQVREGLLGRLYQCTAFYYNGFFNNGTHLLDLLRMFLGDAVSVQATYNRATSNHPLTNDLNIDAVFAWQNDLRVTLHSLTKNYGEFGFHLYGEEGSVSVENLGFEVVYRKKVASRFYNGFFELAPDAQKEGEPRSMMMGSIAHMVSFLKGECAPMSTGEDGLVVMRLLAAAKESADSNGARVSLI